LVLPKIRDNYYDQKGNVEYHETLTSLSWERHGRTDDSSKGTVIMGLTSGRGGRGTRRGAGGGGRADDGQYRPSGEYGSPAEYGRLTGYAFRGRPGASGRFRVRSTHVPVLAVIAAVASLAVVAAAVGVTHALTGRTAADAPPAVDMNCTPYQLPTPARRPGLAVPATGHAVRQALGGCPGLVLLPVPPAALVVVTPHG
jgi:hypothetical protein